MTIYGVTSVFPVAVPALAQATNSFKTAKKHFQDGSKYFKRGDHAAALIEFRIAYELTGRSNPILMMGTCYKNMGQPEKAIAVYQLYLEKTPNSPQRKEVEEAITAMEKEIGQKQGRSPLPVATATPPPQQQDIYVPSPDENNTPVPTKAVDSMAVARKHFQDGSKYFRQDDYAAALTEFRIAYELTGRSNPMLMVGTCYKNMGQPEKALTLYRAYLEKTPDSPQQNEVEEAITAMEKEIGQKQEEPSPPVVTVIPPTQQRDVYIPPPDENNAPKPITQKPQIDEKPAVDAPSPEIIQTKTSTEPLPKKVQLDPWNYIDGDLVAEDEYIPPPATTRKKRSSLNSDIISTTKADHDETPYRTYMWTSFGLSAGSLIVGTVGHFMARNRQAERERFIDYLQTEGQIVGPLGKRNFKNQQAADADNSRKYLDDLESDMNKYGAMELAGFISGVALLSLGGTFYWLDKKQAHLTVTPFANGGTAVWEGRF